MSRRLLPAAVVALAAGLAPALASPAFAQVGDLLAIRAAAFEAASRARSLATAAGADYQKNLFAQLRASCAANATTRLDLVAPASRNAGDGAASFGIVTQKRGSELRSALQLRVPDSIAFDVDVPGDSPVFEAGLSIAEKGAADGVVEFEVAVEDGGARTVLMKRLVRAAPWEDVALDLGAFAGRRVRIVLGVRGTRDATALWSSPVVRPRLGDDRTRPFVVVVEDSMRADRLSVYGGPVAAPAHERVASGGVAFERAFAQATGTTASAASMMTSLLPDVTGVWSGGDVLSERFVTLAEMLRACGFATASFAQTAGAGAHAGLAQGFDVAFDSENIGPGSNDLLTSPSALDAWIAKQRGRPWFAYVHVPEPQAPYDPAVRPDLSAASGDPELPRDPSIDPAWLETPSAAARRKLYDAEAAADDAALGAFLDRLDARGDLARAVIAVVAAHGEFLGEHGGMWGHHPPAHLEVARVPFLLKAPGAVSRRVATPVALLDLAPTLVELAEAGASGLVVQGRSLAAAVHGGNVEDRVVVTDETSDSAGARGCGSFATAASFWLLPCSRDEDWQSGRTPAPGTGTPYPLRIFAMDASGIAVETPPGPLAGALLGGFARRALVEAQARGRDAWTRVSGGTVPPALAEPGVSEGLRAPDHAD